MASYRRASVVPKPPVAPLQYDVSDEAERQRKSFLTNAEFLELESRFRELDLSGTGELQLHQVDGQYFCGLRFTRETFRSLDKDNSGSLSLIELITALFPHINRRDIRRFQQSEITTSEFSLIKQAWDQLRAEAVRRGYRPPEGEAVGVTNPSDPSGTRLLYCGPSIPLAALRAAGDQVAGIHVDVPPEGLAADARLPDGTVTVTLLDALREMYPLVADEYLRRYVAASISYSTWLYFKRAFSAISDNKKSIPHDVFVSAAAAAAASGTRSVERSPLTYQVVVSQIYTARLDYVQRITRQVNLTFARACDRRQTGEVTLFMLLRGWFLSVRPEELSRLHREYSSLESTRRLAEPDVVQLEGHALQVVQTMQKISREAKARRRSLSGQERRRSSVVIPGSPRSREGSVDMSVLQRWRKATTKGLELSKRKKAALIATAAADGEVDVDAIRFALGETDVEAEDGDAAVVASAQKGKVVGQNVFAVWTDAAARASVVRLAHSDYLELLHDFAVMDTDGSGQLTLSEVRQCTGLVQGSSITPEWFATVDANRDGSISFHELVKGLFPGVSLLHLEAHAAILRAAAEGVQKGDIRDVQRKDRDAPGQELVSRNTAVPQGALLAVLDGFAAVDIEGSSAVTLRAVLDRPDRLFLNFRPAAPMTRAIFRHIDADRSGSIDIDEMVGFLFPSVPERSLHAALSRTIEYPRLHRLRHEWHRVFGQGVASVSSKEFAARLSLTCHNRFLEHIIHIPHSEAAAWKARWGGASSASAAAAAMAEEDGAAGTATVPLHSAVRFDHALAYPPAMLKSDAQGAVGVVVRSNLSHAYAVSAKGDFVVTIFPPPTHSPQSPYSLERVLQMIYPFASPITVHFATRTHFTIELYTAMRTAFAWVYAMSLHVLDRSPLPQGVTAASLLSVNVLSTKINEVSYVAGHVADTPVQPLPILPGSLSSSAARERVLRFDRTVFGEMDRDRCGAITLHDVLRHTFLSVPANVLHSSMIKYEQQLQRGGIPLTMSDPLGDASTGRKLTLAMPPYPSLFPQLDDDDDFDAVDDAAVDEFDAVAEEETSKPVDLNLFASAETRNKVTKISYEEFCMLAEDFAVADEDGSGELSLRELKNAGGSLAWLKVDLEMFKRLDRDKNGAISIVELLRGLFPAVPLRRLNELMHLRREGLLSQQSKGDAKDADSRLRTTIIDAADFSDVLDIFWACDPDEGGEIEVGKLRSTLAEKFPDVTVDVSDQRIGEVDVDGSGLLSKLELFTLFYPRIPLKDLKRFFVTVLSAAEVQNHAREFRRISGKRKRLGLAPLLRRDRRFLGMTVDPNAFPDHFACRESSDQHGVLLSDLLAYLYPALDVNYRARLTRTSIKSEDYFAIRHAFSLADESGSGALTFAQYCRAAPPIRLFASVMCEAEEDPEVLATTQASLDFAAFQAADVDRRGAVTLRGFLFFFYPLIPRITLVEQAAKLHNAETGAAIPQVSTVADDDVDDEALAAARSIVAGYRTAGWSRPGSARFGPLQRGASMAVQLQSPSVGSGVGGMRLHREKSVVCTTREKIERGDPIEEVELYKLPLNENERTLAADVDGGVTAASSYLPAPPPLPPAADAVAELYLADNESFGGVGGRKERTLGFGASAVAATRTPLKMVSPHRRLRSEDIAASTKALKSGAAAHPMSDPVRTYSITEQTAISQTLGMHVLALNRTMMRVGAVPQTVPAPTKSLAAAAAQLIPKSLSPRPSTRGRPGSPSSGFRGVSLPPISQSGSLQALSLGPSPSHGGGGGMARGKSVRLTSGKSMRFELTASIHATPSMRIATTTSPPARPDSPSRLGFPTATSFAVTPTSTTGAAAEAAALFRGGSPTRSVTRAGSPERAPRVSIEEASGVGGHTASMERVSARGVSPGKASKASESGVAPASSEGSSARASRKHMRISVLVDSKGRLRAGVGRYAARDIAANPRAIAKALRESQREMDVAATQVAVDAPSPFQLT